MASFLYYCVEVTWMKWLKKYWWYIVISFSSSFVGGIICITITNKNIGSLADWVSGIGSLLAIAFAYWKMIEQRNKEEEDRIFANQPIFSFYKQTFVKRKTDKIWTSVKYSEDSLKDFIKPTNEKDTTVHFKNDIYACCFKNITQAAATSLTLKIEYQDKNTGKPEKVDCCTIGTCVDGKETAIILPDSIIHETTKYAEFQKKFFLYISAIDGNAYCQCWTEIKDKSRNYYPQEESIKKIKRESIPKENISNFTSFS